MCVCVCVDLVYCVMVIVLKEVKCLIKYPVPNMINVISILNID